MMQLALAVSLPMARVDVVERGIFAPRFCCVEINKIAQ